MDRYCKGCHSGASATGGFHLKDVATPGSLRENAHKWSSLTARLRNGEMPPKGSPTPAVDAREQFAEWVEQALRAEACSAGIKPGPALIRRLNRDRADPVVELRLVGETYTITDRGIVRTDDPVVVYRPGVGESP